EEVRIRGNRPARHQERCREGSGGRQGRSRRGGRSVYAATAGLDDVGARRSAGAREILRLRRRRRLGGRGRRRPGAQFHGHVDTALLVGRIRGDGRTPNALLRRLRQLLTSLEYDRVRREGNATTVSACVTVGTSGRTTSSTHERSCGSDVRRIDMGVVFEEIAGDGGRGFVLVV
ncbi:unnamed protein product, partial [Ectocarpus sp. 4 AP-2014]